MFGFLTSGTREIIDPLASVKAVSAWLRGLPAQDVIGRQQAVLGALDSLRQARRPLDPARVQALLGHGPNTTQWTVEQEYVCALLVHQLNTGNMSPAELDWAYAQIRGWSRRLSLDAVARSMEGFLVDVGGKTGFVRPVGNDAGLMLRYLDTTPVCDQLDRANAALRKAESPERSGVL